MRGFPYDLPDAWLEIAEYTLDASRVVLVSENFPIACELAWGAAENAVKATIFHNAGTTEIQEKEYKHHNIRKLYEKVSDEAEDSLNIFQSVQEFGDYDEDIRYPEWKRTGKIRMPADKYTEARAEKALVAAGLILDAARAYVA